MSSQEKSVGSRRIAGAGRGGAFALEGAHYFVTKGNLMKKAHPPEREKRAQIVFSQGANHGLAYSSLQLICGAKGQVHRPLEVRFQNHRRLRTLDAV